MPSQTNEQALETTIEKKLTGTTTEDLKGQAYWLDMREDNLYNSGNSYYIGNAKDSNPRVAIDGYRFLAFFAKLPKRGIGKAAKATRLETKNTERLDRVKKSMV